MGIFDIMLHVRRLMMFGLAVLIGFLFQYMAIPIPFLLGGIVSSMFWKVIGAQVYWPRQWRELGLCVAGYGIGRNFTAETMHELSLVGSEMCIRDSRTSGSTNRRLHLAVDGAYRSNWRCCSAKAAYTNAAPVGANARRVCLLILLRHLSARARPSHDGCANKHRPVYGLSLIHI